MAITVTQLFPPTELGTSAGIVYTSSAVTFQGRIRFTNTSNSLRTVRAYAVEMGDSPGTDNCFLNDEPIAANSHLDSDLPVLAEGGTFQALTDSANDVTVFQLDGVVFS